MRTLLRALRCMGLLDIPPRPVRHSDGARDAPTAEPRGLQARRLSAALRRRLSHYQLLPLCEGGCAAAWSVCVCASEIRHRAAPRPATACASELRRHRLSKGVWAWPATFARRRYQNSCLLTDV